MPAAAVSSTLEDSRQKFTQADPRAEFAALYDAYPVKKARDRAYNIYLGLRQSGNLPPLDKLLSIIAAFRSQDDQWKRGYAPYLATWLQERRWEDELLQREKDSTPAITRPIPEKSQFLSFPARQAEKSLPRETEKTVADLLAVFSALWPEPVNENLVKGSFARAQHLPSPDVLRGRVTEYLAAAGGNTSLFTALMYCKRKDQGHAGGETTSRSGESRIPGLQGRDRKVA
jgi:hypothetical protein